MLFSKMLKFVGIITRTMMLSKFGIKNKVNRKNSEYTIKIKFFITILKKKLPFFANTHLFPPDEERLHSSNTSRVIFILMVY